MEKNKNKKIIGIVIIIALSLSFYAGTKYAQGKVASRGANFQAGGRISGIGGMMRGNGSPAGNVTTGDIISKDTTSITVGLRAGGSKIVFVSSATAISTIASGTPADLISGKQVIIQGTGNQDGSINASNIQVR